jgi:hypothetical protein
VAAVADVSCFNGAACVSEADMRTVSPNEVCLGDVKCWSLALRNNEGDASVVWPLSLQLLFEQHGITGVAAMMQGCRQHRVQLHAVFMCRCCSSDKQLLRASVQRALNMSTGSCKMVLRPLDPQERWDAMVGFVLRDWGGPHGIMRANCIPVEQMQHCRQVYWG